MLGEIAAIASIGSSVLGAAGKGKKQAPTEQSGYITLPGDQKDYAKGRVWDDIIKIYEGGYKGLPKRRLRESEMTGDFAIPELVDLQNYLDSQRAGQPAGISEVATGMDDGAMDEILKGFKLAQSGGNRMARVNPGMNLGVNDYKALARLSSDPFPSARMDEVKKGLDVSKLTPFLAQLMGGA